MSTTLYMYHIVLLRVISVMNIFPHSITPLKVVDHILRKASECTIQLSWFQLIQAVPTSITNSARMHHLASLLSAFSSSSNFHYKQRQNETFSFLVSKCSQLSQLHKEKKSYSVRMHHLLSLLSTFSHHFQLPKTSFKMRKNAPFSFKTVSAVPTLVYSSGLNR